MYIFMTGFMNTWQKRKLGNTAPLRGGFAFQSKKFTSFGIPIIRISNISPNGTVQGNFAYYTEQKSDQNYILENNSLLIAMSGATTGKVAKLKCPVDAKFYQNQRVGYFKPVEKFDYKFIEAILKSNNFVYQLTSVLVSGAQPNISSKEIDSFEFYFPAKEEQSLIGYLNEKCDTLIAVNQRKY